MGDRFYRVALYARSLSDRKTVRPSVRLSVTRANCGKTNESSTYIFTPP